MKRKFKHMVIPVLLVLATLLIVGCNTENEGIFMRISESVEKVDVGAVTLLAKNGDYLFAKTGIGDFYKYNTLTNTWTDLNAKDYRYFSTVGNYIVIGKKAVDDTADNTAFVYDMTDVATPSAIPALDEYMLGMSPQSNYVLTKDPGTTDYYVKKINIGATAYELTDALNSSTELSFVFSADPTLISNDSVNFLLSGQVGTTYRHVLYNGTGLTEYTTSTDFPIVGFTFDGTELIAVTSDGSIWTDSTTTLIEASGSVVIPESNPKTQPYPVFTHNNELYIQDETYDFFKIDAAGTVTEVTTAWTDEFDNIKIKSYLVDGTTVYLGTQTNGIFKFDI